jgi:hypothetical protein
MANRPTKSSEYIRHTFTAEERLKMGDELAQAFNRMADIETEESVLKAQIKERKSQVEQTISKYSRELSNGFTMMTVECRLEWDAPNVNEVSYVRVDTGEVVKTRPFTEAERQADLPLEPGADESQQNIAEFFQSPLVNEIPEGVVVADGPPAVPVPEEKPASEADTIAKAKKKLSLM